MNKHKPFKDKCDGCNQMEVCHGYKDKVLCVKCIKEYIQQENEIDYVPLNSSINKPNIKIPKNYVLNELGIKIFYEQRRFNL